MYPVDTELMDRVDERGVPRKGLSPLMKAKMASSGKNSVNFCPCGCTLADLDDNGYCHHLVGFTVPGNDKKMEAFDPPEQDYPPEMKKTNLMRGHRCVKGKKILPVTKKMKLVLITTCSRVYDPDAVDWRTEDTKQEAVA